MGTYLPVAFGLILTGIGLYSTYRYSFYMRVYGLYNYKGYNRTAKFYLFLAICMIIINLLLSVHCILKHYPIPH